MTADQAYRLLRETVVMRDRNPNRRGIVKSIGYTGFFVNWERGAVEFVDYHQAQHINLWEPEVKP